MSALRFSGSLLALMLVGAAPAAAQTAAAQPLDASRFHPADLGTLSTAAPAPAIEPPLPDAIYAPAPLAGPMGGLPALASPPLSADELAARANSAAFTVPPGPTDNPDPFVVKLQVLLDRAHVSPGVIDGYYGENVSKAIAAAETMAGLPADGVVDADLWALLEGGDGSPVLAPYVLNEEDVAGPFVPDMPSDYGEMAELDRLAYRDPIERIAERFHMDEFFLRRLNPGKRFDAGETILVADVGAPAEVKVVRIIADKGTRQVLGYDAGGRLAVAYPATIGSSGQPSPTGRHAVKAVVKDAEYWYRPDVNFKQGDNTKPLRLAPGPNNPIGAVWIGLDKPTYGIHGTPEPSKIDKTNSHGCVRLTNWDARELAGLIKRGVPVDFVETATNPLEPAEARR
jgi:lipoprotein-anchoring transpeptidase ErfK/SrfK